MKLALSGVLLFGCVAAAAAQDPGDAREALLGFDPVILVDEGREVLGDENVSVVRDHFWYLFANEENKRKFERDPERYSIQLGGLCARMGGLTEGNPDNFLVHEGKVYIFGSQQCRELFAAHAEDYLDPGPPEVQATPESEEKGRQLVSKAVQWLGGGERLDGLRSYRVKATVEIAGDRAEVDLARVFDSRFRRLVKHPRYGEFGEILDDERAYRLGGAGARPMSAAQREGLYQELGRDPVALLRARRRKDFQAVWLGTAPDSDAERVWVGLRRLGAVLEIDPERGAIRAMSYSGRGPGGKFGVVRKQFGDFREISGLRWPFATEATFDGRPFPEEGLTVESISIDEPIPDQLFQPKS